MTFPLKGEDVKVMGRLQCWLVCPYASFYLTAPSKDAYATSEVRAAVVDVQWERRLLHQSVAIALTPYLIVVIVVALGLSYRRPQVRSMIYNI